MFLPRRNAAQGMRAIANMRTEQIVLAVRQALDPAVALFVGVSPKFRPQHRQRRAGQRGLVAGVEDADRDISARARPRVQQAKRARTEQY